MPSRGGRVKPGHGGRRRARTRGDRPGARRPRAPGRDDTSDGRSGEPLRSFRKVHSGPKKKHLAAGGSQVQDVWRHESELLAGRASGTGSARDARRPPADGKLAGVLGRDTRVSLASVGIDRSDTGHRTKILGVPGTIVATARAFLRRPIDLVTAQESRISLDAPPPRSLHSARSSCAGPHAGGRKPLRRAFSFRFGKKESILRAHEPMHERSPSEGVRRWL